MNYLGLTLDPFQKRAIKAIDEGRSVLVAAPTGTGKTLIADYLVDTILKRGERIIYTAPIKALSNQKYRDYSKRHGVDKVGLVTGDIVINSDAPIRVMTTEILRNILLQGAGPSGDPEQLGDLGAVIFDELHFLDDPERGTVWEEVLIYLPEKVRVLGLSATMPNIDELAGWLEHVRPGQGPIAVVQERKRAVPLEFLFLSNDTGLQNMKGFEDAHRTWRKEQSSQNNDEGHRRKGRNRRERREKLRENNRRGHRRGRRDDGTTFRDMIKKLRPQDFPALFFVFSRRITEQYARGLTSKAHNKGYLQPPERKRVQERLDQFEQDNPDILEDVHRQMYLRGVAFHHAGLHVQLKSLVEGLYEQRLIKILFCTSTFALGINMPARTVLFEKLEKYNGHEVAPLSVRQFMQKAGRAGRRGLDPAGQVILRMELPQWRAKRDYIHKLIDGRDEPVNSSFNLSFHSVVNLLERFNEEEIENLLSRSFLAWQRARHHEALREKLERGQARLRMAQRTRDKGQESHNPQDTRQIEKKVAKLERRLKREQRWLWRQFEDKVNFLKEIGYMEQDGSFSAGARILRTVQIEEVMVAEIILSGVLEQLTPEEVFALCVGLTMELAPKVWVGFDPPRALQAQIGTLDKIMTSDMLARAVDLAGGEPRCDARMFALGHQWATGATLAEMLLQVRSHNDVSGDMVGAVRRGKDLMGQLRVLFQDQDPERAKAYRAVMRQVSRDEVEAI